MNWSTENNRYTTTIGFTNQSYLAQFLHEVAIYSDTVGHHGDYSIEKCSQLNITVFSHDTNGITDRDHDLVKEIERIGVKYGV